MVRAEVRRLLPLIKQRALDADQGRRIPAETIHELRESGLLHARRPIEMGGLGLPRQIFREITHQLAQACGSTGWVFGVVGSTAGFLASVFPREAQQAVWDVGDEGLICNSLFPGGIAEPCHGGYILSGRFPFASGCDICQWAIVGARIVGKEFPTGAMSWGCLIPMSAVSVTDDWQVLGLAATGSKTLSVENVFVPSTHVAAIPDPVGTTAHYSFSTIAVGIAAGGIDRFIEYVVARESIASGWSAETDGLQVLLSESAAEVDAAWALICRDCAEGESWEEERSIPPAIRARNQRNAAFATVLSVRAMDRLIGTCSGSVAHSSSPVQLAFRDVHTAALHYSMHWGVAARDSGRELIKLGRLD
jgi:alkylation response protein AidB-like acyl-CoA dehydrogenase